MYTQTSRKPHDHDLFVPRVLLVEDDPEQAALISRWLSSDLGARATVVSDGASAWAAVRGLEWDLLISDIELPGVCGTEVVRCAKALAPERPAVLITAELSDTRAIQAVGSRADRLMCKPLRRADVAGLVRDLARPAPQATGTTVLAIGAHPDDVEIGVGGALLRHVEAGDRVIIATLSPGSQGGQQAVRLAESKRAAELLGAELFIGDLPDTEVPANGPTVAFIEALVRRFKPDVVYTHTVNDNHQDHRAVHRASIIACRTVPTLLCYQTPSASIGFTPQVFIDVAPHISRKLDLIHQYGSQTERSYLADEMVQATARYWGRFAGYGVVEPLEVIRSAT